MSTCYTSGPFLKRGVTLANFQSWDARSHMRLWLKMGLKGLKIVFTRFFCKTGYIPSTPSYMSALRLFCLSYTVSCTVYHTLSLVHFIMHCLMHSLSYTLSCTVYHELFLLQFIITVSCTVCHTLYSAFYIIFF